MPNEKTRADSLRCFLTGASSHGGAQSDPDLSLGNHQSNTLVEQVSWDVSSPISGITVDYVAGANGLGAGTLTATGISTLKWTPPGGTQGAAVEIANGETKIIEGGANALDKFIRVSRTSASDLTGAATVTVAEAMNNVFGLDTVTSAEQSAGDDEYRCICMENMSSAEIKNLKVTLETLGTQRTSDSAQLGASGAGTIQTSGSFADWPEIGWVAIRQSGGTLREVAYYSSRTSDTLTVPAAGRALLGTTASAGTATDTVDAIPPFRLGKDAPSSQPSGSFVDNTGAGEDTAPAGVTLSVAITAAEAIDIGDLAANEIYGLWLHRQIPVGAEAGLSFLNHLKIEFDAA